MAEQPQVVDMVDAIGANAGAIPKGTKKVAIYLTGSGGVAWTNADVARLNQDDPELQTIVRIDQANQSTEIFHQVAYLIVDIEPGAATLTDAIRIAKARQQLGLRTCFYFFRAEEQAVRDAAAGNGLHVDYWAAYWDLDREQAIAQLGQRGVVAVQWASPTSNPHTLVPGTNRTIASLNVDLSVTLANWPSPVAHTARPPKKHRVKRVVKKLRKLHPKVATSSIASAVTAALLAIAAQDGAHITQVEKCAITTAVVLVVGYLTPSRSAIP